MQEPSPLLLSHQSVLQRFTTLCQADRRIIAAFLGGSHARGTADAWSDLDLYLVTTDDAHADFLASRHDFVSQLGPLLFLEDFDQPDMLFFIFANGLEGELGIGRESHFAGLTGGPAQVLLDKTGVLEGASFTLEPPSSEFQQERLRRLLNWFWHDLSHFITAVSRGQLWWAAGQLEVLRSCTARLTLLRHDFNASFDDAEPYFKIDKRLPPDELARLQNTFVPLERRALLQAARAVVAAFQELGAPLAEAHGQPYPAQLAQLMLARLEKLSPESNEGLVANNQT